MKPLINLAEDYRKAAVVLRLAIEDRREQAAQGNSVAARELALLRQCVVFYSAIAAE